ncbi:MAG: metal-dependent transcriptional regulator [Dehalococcoidales bacterium]|nr:metal-dependent transcriptional regulator [Dehalococcoidales bacterium]
MVEFAGEITSSMQDYLEAMLILSESADEIRVTDIASRLNVAKASVAQAINHLKKHGMVTQERYGAIELTEAGKRMAVEVRWRHRKIKQFLTDILEVDPAIAEKDACLMEHVVSSHTMMRMMKYLEITRDLKAAKRPLSADQRLTEETGPDVYEEKDLAATKTVRSLDELKAGERGRIIRVASDKKLKSRILDMGITPGSEITVKGCAPLGDPVEVNIKGYELTLRKNEASQIYVEVF